MKSKLYSRNTLDYNKKEFIGKGDSMARQIKKIQGKLQPKKAQKDEPKKKGRDIFLLIMIGFTFFILLMGWREFDILYRSMYSALTLALILVYGQRQGSFADKIRYYMGVVSFVLIMLSFILFGITCYYKYIAG